MATKQSSTAHFDIIVVGGGSAGAVMASRLSEDSNRHVLLLEAGPAYPAWDYPDVIASASNVGGDPVHNWGYHAETAPANAPVDLPRGKVLGGSSAINGAVALRPRPEDLAAWNLPGWSFEEMLPYFRKLEKSDSGDKDLHGFDGPLPVRQLFRSDLTSVQQAFIDATVNVGYKAIEDFDGPDANGVGPYRMNVVNGIRVNTGMAYLTNKVRERQNLQIISGSVVDRVLFEDSKAVGIVLAGGERFYAKEIVLSAGTYGSAAILLRSGIGPKSASEQLAIPVVADLPVGLNLKEHPMHYAAYAVHKEMVDRLSPPIAAKLWTSTAESRGALDLHITAVHLFPHEYSPTKMGFVLGVCVTTPLSKGSIRIESKDPLAAPKIDLNLLGHESDLNRMIEGAKIARQIAAAAPFSGFVHSEIAPGASVTTDEQLAEAIRKNVATYAHPTSSAPMGAAGSANAVVDPEGRVHGIAGLRVVDASIFPDIVSVATNVLTIAVAERIADLMSARQN